MAEKEKKSKKQKNTIALPKAWQSVKHSSETSQMKTDLNGFVSAIGMILLILAILFVLLGGVSQTGILKIVFNWSHNVGTTISNWFEGASIVTNEDGVYLDPTGKKGEKIGDENKPDLVNPADEIDKETTNKNTKDTNKKTKKSNKKIEVKNE